MVALDATTGERRWTESTHAVTGGPVAHTNGIIVQSHEDVIAFETDGSRRWSFNVLEGTARPIAVDDRHVYVAARNALHAIDWNGDEVWIYEASGERIGPPTIAGQTVLVRGEDHLTALSRSDGTEQWTATPQGVGRAVAVPEAIFLSGTGGNVIALGEA